MYNKVVIITGANSGIGKETAQQLAQQGATIVMACRDAERAKAAHAEIVANSGPLDIHTMTLDLASFASIRQFAREFQQRFSQLDVLINNAGVFPMQKQLTADGFESQMGVNHLGHFLLTHLLLPQLLAAPQARVIQVASMMHHLGHIDEQSFTGQKRYFPFGSYGQSKLANVLFTRELARRYGDQGIQAYSLHPGAVATNIMGRSFIRRNLYRLLGGYMNPQRGAKTSVFLASSPQINAANGSYFNEFCRIKKGSKLSRDVSLGQKLWQTSTELTKTEQ